MAVATLEDLEAVPIGQRIFYNEQSYKHVSEGWWSLDGDEPIIRSRHFVGAVAAGQVSLDDERPLKAGTVAQDATYWYIFNEDSDAANIRCTVIRRSNGVVDYTDHPMRLSTMRRHVMDPQPALAPAIKVLSEQIKAKDEVIASLTTQVGQVRDQFVALETSLAEAGTFRTALRTFLNQGDVVPAGPLTEWQGAKVGEEIASGSDLYRTLPVGSVVKYGARNYWWKVTHYDGTGYVWRSRATGDDSHRMSRNTLVTIGNGIEADPGTTI